MSFKIDKLTFIVDFNIQMLAICRGDASDGSIDCRDVQQVAVDADARNERHLSALAVFCLLVQTCETLFMRRLSAANR